MHSKCFGDERLLSAENTSSQSQNLNQSGWKNVFLCNSFIHRWKSRQKVLSGPSRKWFIVCNKVHSFLHWLHCMENWNNDHDSLKLLLMMSMTMLTMTMTPTTKWHLALPSHEGIVSSRPVKKSVNTSSPPGTVFSWSVLSIRASLKIKIYIMSHDPTGWQVQE